MRKVLFLLAFFASTLLLAADGLVTQTSIGVGAGLMKYTLSWTSDALGTADALVDIKRGYLVQIKFIPGVGGSQPSASYDVLLKDVDGADFLGATGANLSQTVTTLTAVSPAKYYDGVNRLELNVTNAGIVKTGTVILWIGAPR